MQKGKTILLPVFLLIEHLFVFKKHNSMSVCDIFPYLVTYGS